MANPYFINPLGGFNLVGAVAGLGEQYRQSQDQERMMKERQDMQAFLRQAADGDPDAIKEVFSRNPNIGLKLQEIERQRFENLGAAKKRMMDESNLDYAKRLKFAAPEDRSIIIQEAIVDPSSDLFDESDINISPEQALFESNMALFSNLGDKGYKALVSSSQADPVKLQELEIKKEANEIRRLENQERSLDRQLARETNELKRQELEDKISSNRTQREQKERDVKSQADNAIATFDNSLQTINKILGSEGFSSAVGARLPFIDSLPGSAAQETIGLIETLESQNFLNQIEKMKGLGALSNAEGQKVASAIGSLNRNMSEEAFKRSLNQIRGFIEKGRKNVLEKYGQPEREKQTETVKWDDL